jgi:MFS family permease
VTRPGGIRRFEPTGPQVTLSLCVGSYFAVRFSQVAIGPLVSTIIGEFTLSRADIGVALTGMWVAYALVQLPGGLVADRVGERSTVVLALAVTGTATAALTLATSGALFLAGLVAMGVGAGLYYNPATSLLEMEFESVGRVVGTHRVGGQSAGAIGPIAVTALAFGYGWRSAFACGAVLAVAMAALFYWWTEPTSPDSREPGGPIADTDALRRLAARPHTRRTTLMATLVEFAGLASMSFLPVFLVQHVGLRTGPANVLLATYFAVVALVQPFGGYLSDRLGRDVTTALLAVAGVAGYGALALGISLLAVPGVVLAGTGVSSVSVIQSRMLDGLPDRDQGAGFGLFRTGYLLVGASGTAVVGTLADAFGWTVAFGSLGLVFAVLLGSAVAFRGTDRSDPSR